MHHSCTPTKLASLLTLSNQVEGREESESEEEEDGEPEQLPVPSQAAASLPPPPAAGIFVHPCMFKASILRTG